MSFALSETLKTSFLAVPWVCLQFVIVVFPDQTHLLFLVCRGPSFVSIFQSMLRTSCLRQFGYFLSRLDGLQFTYNEEKGIFIGPTQPTTADDTQEIAMEKMVIFFFLFQMKC